MRLSNLKITKNIFYFIWLLSWSSCKKIGIFQRVIFLHYLRTLTATMYIFFITSDCRDFNEETLHRLKKKSRYFDVRIFEWNLDSRLPDISQYKGKNKCYKSKSYRVFGTQQLNLLWISLKKIFSIKDKNKKVSEHSSRQKLNTKAFWFASKGFYFRWIHFFWNYVENCLLNIFKVQIL